MEATGASSIARWALTGNAHRPGLADGAVRPVVQLRSLSYPAGGLPPLRSRPALLRALRSPGPPGHAASCEPALSAHAARSGRQRGPPTALSPAATGRNASGFSAGHGCGFMCALGDCFAVAVAGVDHAAHRLSFLRLPMSAAVASALVASSHRDPFRHRTRASTQWLAAAGDGARPPSGKSIVGHH